MRADGAPYQVTVVCERCDHPLVLSLSDDLTLSIEDSIRTIAAALALHIRVGCMYSPRARTHA